MAREDVPHAEACALHVLRCGILARLDEGGRGSLLRELACCPELLHRCTEQAAGGCGLDGHAAIPDGGGGVAQEGLEVEEY